MLHFVASQIHLWERQRIGIPRIVHIQHGGAVALDGDGFGLSCIIGEMIVVTTCKALILVVLALFLGTGGYICRLIGSGYAVTIVIGVLIPENNSKTRFANIPACLMA